MPPITLRLEREARKAYPIHKVGMLDAKCNQIKKQYRMINRQIHASPESEEDFNGTPSPRYKALKKKLAPSDI